jgi:RNA polymerase sigma factor (sigma-70 family)
VVKEPEMTGMPLQLPESKRAFLTAMQEAHGPRLRRYLAVRMRNSAADVPDLMQEVFLRLLRIDHHEVIRNPQAYLYTVAAHLLHQYTLRQSAAPKAFEADWESEMPSSTEADPARTVEMEQRFEAMGRALEKVSPRAYATLVMHRCNGVPLKEVADQMGISYRMAKRYLATALTFCREHLDEGG